MSSVYRLLFDLVFRRMDPERHSHSRPRNGRTSGTYPYPWPKADHTVSSGNSPTSTRERTPTVRTPTSSIDTAHHASRRQSLASAIVATTYTRPAASDSRYATGASESFVATW